MHEQNAEHLNKLWLVIDDIERATKSQSDKLKSRITSKTVRVKKLYSDPVTLPSYFDLICTSNDRSPCFISDQNRRNEMVSINPELKGDLNNNVEFWNGFYAELEDSQICGAWFEFLATYKIELNVRSEMCRFDVATLDEHKIKSMKATHRWLCQFFTDHRCFEAACKNKSQETAWFDSLDFKKTGGITACWITIKRAYEYFEYWARTGGTRTPPKDTNFVEDLAEMGIERKRKPMTRGSKRYLYVFQKLIVKKSLKCFYGVEKLPMGSWCFEDPSEFKALQDQDRDGNWRFYAGPRTNGHGFL